MPEAVSPQSLYYKVERGDPPASVGARNLSPHRAAVRSLRPGQTVLLPLLPSFNAVHLAVVKERARSPQYRYFTRQMRDGIRVWCVAQS